MTDEEMKPWLSEDEWHGTDVWKLLRTLAETRKALAVYDATTGLGCRLCDFVHPTEMHAPDCIFTTMPRPKP